MKVTVNNVEEFLYCLDDEDEVFDDTVRLSLERVSKLEGVKDPVVFDVTAKFGAILSAGETDCYLLEGSEDCGTDYEDATQDLSGSKRALEIKEQIEVYAKEKRWKIKPGVFTHQ